MSIDQGVANAFNYISNIFILKLNNKPLNEEEVMLEFVCLQTLEKHQKMIGIALDEIITEQNKSKRNRKKYNKQPDAESDNP